LGSGDARAVDVVGCSSMGAGVDDLSLGTREPDVSGEAIVIDGSGPEVTDGTSHVFSTSKGLFLGRGRDGDGGGPG